jgi:hypothetical protein
MQEKRRPGAGRQKMDRLSEKETGRRKPRSRLTESPLDAVQQIAEAAQGPARAPPEAAAVVLHHFAADRGNRHADENPGADSSHESHCLLMHRIKPPYRINPANQFAYVHYSFPLFSEYRSELLESPRAGFPILPL